ncbi:unnamed protein product [Rhizophagus irregularis]|nr:unnamed protein product [Rhizophagus irregularis]
MQYNVERRKTYKFTDQIYNNHCISQTTRHLINIFAMVQLYADILLLIMLELQDDISSLHSCILSNHQTSKLTYLLWFNFTQIFFY